MRKQHFSSIILALFLFACGKPTPASQAPNPTAAPQSRELYVFAAASLTQPFTEIIQTFEQSHPGVRIIPNYAGSQQLAQQIAQGAPADVFASADQTQMAAAAASGRIDLASEQVFANNHLVVILPGDNPGEISSLKDLALPGHSLILAAEAVPVGKYSLTFLEQASQDPKFGSGYKAAVLKNVVSYEENVKAVLSKIILGEADCGIVYTSDAATTKPDQIISIEIPASLNAQAAYYLAPLNDSQAPDLAKAFIAAVLSPGGQDILSQYGFLPVQ